MDVDRLFLVSRMKKVQFQQNISKFFFIITIESSLLTSVVIFSTISQILKTKFYIFFVYKYVETGPNCSLEFATFLKYHMPLKSNYIIETLS